MRILLVHAHPEPASFCGALMRCAHDTLGRCGHDVVVSDLYASAFNAVGGPHDFLQLAHAERFAYQREQMAAVSAHSFEPTLGVEIERLRDRGAGAGVHAQGKEC